MRNVLSYLLLLGLVGACCWLPPPGPGGASSTPAPVPGEAELNALESQLVEGRHYSEGPGAEIIAGAVRMNIEARDALAVRTMLAADGHQQIVVVIQFDDDATEGLADLDDDQRRRYLDNILDTVRAISGPFAEIGVGIRGNVFYGAIGISRTGAPNTYDIGFSVQPDALSALLVPPAAVIPASPPVPVPVPVPVPTPPPPSGPPPSGGSGAPAPEAAPPSTSL